MNTRRVASPLNTRHASLLVGPCPGATPEVLVGFDRGDDGASVFTLADSSAQLEATWLSEDTLQITYPRNAHIVKQDSTARFNHETIVIVYRQAEATTR